MYECLCFAIINASVEFVGKVSHVMIIFVACSVRFKVLNVVSCQGQCFGFKIETISYTEGGACMEILFVEYFTLRLIGL